MKRPLKFAGRTPSRILPSAQQTQWRSSRQRENVRLGALIVAAFCVLLMMGVATLRGFLGDTAPDGGILRIWNGASIVAFDGQLQLVPVAASWWQIFGAPILWGGEAAQAMTPRGLLWIIVLALVLGLAWNALANTLNWRRPIVPFIVLLTLQITGAMYYASSFNVPSRKIETLTQNLGFNQTKAPFITFDFHCHTTLSSGLMTPQQQINWHRARGFNGLAFTDSNRLMSDTQLSALRAANPDMILLNGCEYQIGKVHLIFLGLSRVVNKRMAPQAEDAIKQAKAQAALVIVAHPWESKYSAEELLRMGVDGFETANGVIWSKEMANLAYSRNLLTTAVTDDASKSGSRCATWTVLRSDVSTPQKVIEALKARQTALAVSLNEEQSPAAFVDKRRFARNPLIMFSAMREAWTRLAPAQQISTVLGWIAALSLLVAWSAVPAPARNSLAKSHSGPQHAARFLRKRRFSHRSVAVVLMLIAFLVSIAAAILAMGEDISLPLFDFTPLHAIFVWLLMDAVFLLGWRGWKTIE